ncbi:3 transmembrane region [Cryptosporidium sp. chipmunk genotype I]|uniref:3 transmembrane region n=1 Tax=Cryptosporidium sp. chipmunk genotype I TaxID=1280935 RepID=UPI00351A3E36|nr:3 transmembrane region [Cryptosporidium sp. chipmunk genotype I]
MFKRGVIIANLANLVIAILLSGCAFGGIMLVQNWIMFDGVLLSWELTPSQLFITLNCSSRSKRFMSFCVNGIKGIHGNFVNVVQAICNPPEKYKFLASSCEEVISLTNYLNIIYLVLLVSASVVIFGIIFLMIYSRSFKVEDNNTDSKNFEVILKSKPRIGFAVVSILFNILALLGVGFCTVLVIYLSQSLQDILSFTSDVPMFTIEPYKGSLGWGFYLLLLANSLLTVHILALVDSTKMAKRLWIFSQEIMDNSATKQYSEIVIKNTNKIPDKFFVHSLSPSSMKAQGSQSTGSTFLPSSGVVGSRIQAPITNESQPNCQYMPLIQNQPQIQTQTQTTLLQNQQLYPRISSTPATRSVWGFFPINLLPRFNPYNSGMTNFMNSYGNHHCHGHEGCNHHHHHHYHHN